MKRLLIAPLALCASVAVASPELEAKVEEMMLTSFKESGIASLDRQKRDAVQKACSSPELPDSATMKKLEEAEMATIQWPSNGDYLGGIGSRVRRSPTAVVASPGPMPRRTTMVAAATTATQWTPRKFLQAPLG